VFAFLNGGNLGIELGPAWTNSNTRSTIVGRQTHGVLVKGGQAGDWSRRYVGSIRTVSATQTTSNTTARYLYNYYNQIDKTIIFGSGDISHTYGSSTARRVNDADNGTRFLMGISQEQAIQIMGAVFATMSGTGGNGQFAAGFRIETTAADIITAWNGVIDTGAHVWVSISLPMPVDFVGIMQPNVYERSFANNIDMSFYALQMSLRC
jgi:hypothetical protein